MSETFTDLWRCPDFYITIRSFTQKVSELTFPSVRNPSPTRLTCRDQAWAAIKLAESKQNALSETPSGRSEISIPRCPRFTGASGALNQNYPMYVIGDPVL